MSDGTYRRPGVYLEERLQQSPTQAGSATAVAVFAGVTAKGPIQEAVRIDSWTDFVVKFGGFDPATVHDGSAPGVNSTLKSFLPYSVFNYYQNGGRAAYIVRVVPAATNAQGVVASVTTNNGAGTPVPSFGVKANGVGVWGNGLTVAIANQVLDPDGNQVFALSVFAGGSVLETFTNLSMTGVQGTRPVLGAVNDPLAGSRYVTIIPATAGAPAPAAAVYTLTGGVDPGTPTTAELVGAPITTAMRQIESPLVASFQPFMKADGTIVMPQASAGVTTALNSNGRTDCFVVWDGNPLSLVSSGTYTANLTALAATIGTADSYSAVFAPWIITPDPARAGSTIVVPPSGSVQGMIARIDATNGPWRTPAGLPAVLSTAVATEVKFSDTDQGNLNAANINVVRSVPGSGICVMGGRTRKLYGPDRYINARRTLIYIEEALKLSTQWATFENNDQRLWSSLRNTAQNILQPIWEVAGLKGSTAAEAYYVRCDATINNAQVVQNGEVRMEVGVALQYPAEFIIIRVSQFDSGVSLANELVAA